MYKSLINNRIITYLVEKTNKDDLILENFFLRSEAKQLNYLSNVVKNSMLIFL